MEKYLFALPLALSVSCPGSLGDSLPHVDALKTRLVRSEGCCMETRGWIHGFIVRLREHAAEKVKALIVEAGCTITEETVQHYEWPESQSGDQHQLPQRQFEPWNALPYVPIFRDADEPNIAPPATIPEPVTIKLHRPSQGEPVVPAA